MEKSNYPPGWDEDRVRRVIAHYEQQTEEESVAEDEAAFEDEDVREQARPASGQRFVRGEDLVALRVGQELRGGSVGR